MERQIKSKKRVADHGEVFTAEREVNAMLDLVKEQTDQVESRFLEPACGDGNFLAEILRRKLAAAKRISTPPRRKRPEPFDFEKKSFLAVTSIYGVDLLQDNVTACRERLYKIWDKEYKSVCKKETNEQTREAVRFVLSRNIVCGNALTLKCVDSEGNDTNDPIIFSEWSFITGVNIQRKDYTFDELVNGPSQSQPEPFVGEQLSLAPVPQEGPDPEGKFLKQYVSFYRSVQDMEKTPYLFSIQLSSGGESEVEYLVTPEELALIRTAVENGDCFSDIEELSDLYQRVMEAAAEQLEEDLDLDNKLELDPDDLDYCVEFGEEMEET